MTNFHLAWNGYDWIGIALLGIGVCLRVTYGPLKSDSPRPWRIASAVAYVLPLVAIVALISWHNVWHFMDREGLGLLLAVAVIEILWNLVKGKFKWEPVRLVQFFKGFLPTAAFFLLVFYMPQPVPLMAWGGLLVWLFAGLVDLLWRYRISRLTKVSAQ